MGCGVKVGQCSGNIPGFSVNLLERFEHGTKAVDKL